jgi:GNAT superfamily N-acetyltransferase
MSARAGSLNDPDAGVWRGLAARAITARRDLAEQSAMPEPAPVRGSKRLELAAVVAADLPLLEGFVRAYYLEDGHTFREDRQQTALAALVASEPLCRAWLIRLDARPVGYVVLALTFSVEAGGREACVDEFYLLPDVRNQGLGSGALALVEAEARDLAVRRIFLEVQRGNRVIGLYRRAGYVDHDRYLMSKFLSE